MMLYTLPAICKNFCVPKPEKKPPYSTRQEIQAQVRQLALREGRHVPLLIVEGSQTNVIAQLHHLPETHEGRAQILFQLGFALVQDGFPGIPVQVFFISEAWMSLVQDETHLASPSQDPNRIEVLVIAGLHLLEHWQSLVVLEMIRQDNQLVDLQERVDQVSTDGSVSSPLLDAFILGYMAGVNARNAPHT